MAKTTIEVLVEGGKASGGPPLGPAIGPLGLNINEVVNTINQKTAEFEGMKIPVKVTVDTDTKEYAISVGSPPTSALIKKELGLEKATGDGTTVGNLTFEQLIKITNMKRGQLIANSKKSAVKEIIGTCASMGINIEGKSADEITEEIDQGKYDDKLSVVSDKS